MFLGNRGCDKDPERMSACIAFNFDQSVCQVIMQSSKTVYTIRIAPESELLFEKCIISYLHKINLHILSITLSVTQTCFIQGRALPTTFTLILDILMDELICWTECEHVRADSLRSEKVMLSLCFFPQSAG